MYFIFIGIYYLFYSYVTYGLYWALREIILHKGRRSKDDTPNKVTIHYGDVNTDLYLKMISLPYFLVKNVCKLRTHYVFGFNNTLTNFQMKYLIN